MGLGWLLGLELPALARDGFPQGQPARRWLEHYATLFDTAEGSYTFYSLPPSADVANWVEQTPPGFLFTVEAGRFGFVLLQRFTIGRCSRSSDCSR
jgi:uncharacterized protein YecE (DUF72 family)